jgi:hypothetical protein
MLDEAFEYLEERKVRARIFFVWFTVSYACCSSYAC